MRTFTWRESAKICSELRNFSAKKLLFYKIFLGASPQTPNCRGAQPLPRPLPFALLTIPPTFQQAPTPLAISSVIYNIVAVTILHINRVEGEIPGVVLLCEISCMINYRPVTSPSPTKSKSKSKPVLKYKSKSILLNRYRVVKMEMITSNRNRLLIDINRVICFVLFHQTQNGWYFCFFLGGGIKPKDVGVEHFPLSRNNWCTKMTSGDIPHGLPILR